MENKNDLAYHLTTHLRLNAIYWGLTALCVMGRKDALNREEMIEFVFSCWDEDAGASIRSRVFAISQPSTQAHSERILITTHTCCPPSAQSKYWLSMELLNDWMLLESSSVSRSTHSSPWRSLSTKVKSSLRYRTQTAHFRATDSARLILASPIVLCRLSPN